MVHSALGRPRHSIGISISIMNTTGDDDAIATASTDLHDAPPNEGDVVACERGEVVDADAVAAVDGLISISQLPPPPTTRPHHLPPPRRRSLRPSFEPERFVARPSRRGLTNADGDAVYLAGGVLVGGGVMSMSASGNSSIDLTAAAGADDIIDDSKHHPIKKEYEDWGETERVDCDSSEKLGKLPEDTQADVRPIESELMKPAKSEEIGAAPEPEPIMPPTQHSADAFSLSMQSEYSDMPQCSLLKSNVHNDDDNLGEIQVDSISSTPVIEHDPKPPVTHSADVNTESRYPKRTRITKSMREEWEDDTGSSAAAVAIASTDYDGMLDFQISPTSVPKKGCRAISCTKFSQGPHGLCYSHYNRYLMCTGQVKFWTCECGNKVKLSVRWCRNCRYSLTKGSPSSGRTPSPPKGVVVEVEDDDDEEEVEFLRATPVARKKPRSRSNSTLRSDEHSRYPKRNTRNLAEEITQSGLTNDVPLSPRRTPLREGRARTPTSSSSVRSSIFTQLDNMLDFSVTSPSTPFRSPKCRASSCHKHAQSKSNGFCRRHYNRYLICTGQAASWTCGDCGHRNIDISKQCGECNQKRNGASPMSSEGMISPVAVTKKAGKKREEVDETIRDSGRKGSAQLKEDEGDNKMSPPSSSGGIRSRQTYVPPEFADQISQQRRKHKKGRLFCKVSTCDKFERSCKDGFCSHHFNLFALESGGEADKRTNRSSSLSTTSSSAPVSFANVPEVTLLERTRTELLNGRDYWICTDCAVEVPSITYPCGKCNKMISFVPLEMGEFEEFVHKQREMNLKKKQEEEQRQMKELCGAGGREH